MHPLLPSDHTHLRAPRWRLYIYKINLAMHANRCTAGTSLVIACVVTRHLANLLKTTSQPKQTQVPLENQYLASFSIFFCFLKSTDPSAVPQVLSDTATTQEAEIISKKCSGHSVFHFFLTLQILRNSEESS